MFACPNRRFLGNYLSKRQVGRVLAKSLVMIDLQKAIDTVNHAIMSDKLGAIGCDDGSVNWFNSYLSNSQQISIYRHKGHFIRSQK